MAGDLALPRCRQASLGSSRGAAGQTSSQMGINSVRLASWMEEGSVFLFFNTELFPSYIIIKCIYLFFFFFNIQTTTALQILKEAAALKQELLGLSRRALRLGPPS